MFENIIKKIVNKVEGIKYIGIWGLDGLELENILVEDIDVDFELFGAEAADVVKRIRLTKENCSDFVLKNYHKDLKMIIKPVNENYFYMVLLDENSIVNKLEFYLNLFNRDLVERIN